MGNAEVSFRLPAARHKGTPGFRLSGADSGIICGHNRDGGMRVRAQQVQGLEGPSGLRLVEVDEPEDAARVVIEVAAAGVSFPDLLLTRGEYQMKPPLPFVPGVEVAGRVRSAPRGIGIQRRRSRDGLHHAGRLRRRRRGRTGADPRNPGRTDRRGRIRIRHELPHRAFRARSAGTDPAGRSRGDPRRRGRGWHRRRAGCSRARRRGDRDRRGARQDAHRRARRARIVSSTPRATGSQRCGPRTTGAASTPSSTPSAASDSTRASAASRPRDASSWSASPRAAFPACR